MLRSKPDKNRKEESAIIKWEGPGVDCDNMPDFLRPAVYPVLLVCIVGSLWMLASTGSPLGPEWPAAYEQAQRPQLHLPCSRPSSTDLASIEEGE
ncbi:MAG TPA: hypothetical protein VFW23_03995 [Tepidisphaeraceae bacterium]|nr:hypothetical protein [Tepidisphaeraceae bacterium]